MRPARIVLLLVALIAGGLAAYLATRGPGPQTDVEQAAAPIAAPQAQVLVAKQPIGVGERLTANEVEWQSWPADAVRGEYITSAKTPDAPAKVVGTVARFEIFQGEPILDAKLVHTDQGYLSAVLSAGMRGVSIPISAASGSGGFIIPNDRVDVVVTENSQGQSNSHVLLSNVKVLAIGARLGQTGTTGTPTDPADPKSQMFTDSIATLELTPGQADTMINAAASGKISLVLRSVVDFASTGPQGGASAPAAQDNQQVKIIRFGRSINVTPGSPAAAQATVNPVAFVAPAPAAAATTTTTVETTPAATPAAPAAAAPAGTTVTTTVTNPAAGSAQKSGVQSAPVIPAE